MANLIVSAIILLLIICAVSSMIKNRGGCGGCGGSCGGCEHGKPPAS